MKVNSTANNEVLTNSNNESKFSINASAQAFRILSDGIYEHKVAAIVRELSCNAYDAHVEAGKRSEPFKVVLPNNLHPYFEIEDFGIGLDDDGVRTVYTSYFTSTKNDSNEAIGAFGLGSKTPFAYTSNFTIRARKDGVERLYTAYIGQDGAPTVNLMIERESQESNGVKITVPIRETDFSEFSKEASWILSFFSVTPVVNDPNFELVFDDVADEIEEGDIVVRNKRVSRFSRSSALYNKRIYAVMGGVCYGVNTNTLSDKIDQSSLAYLNKVILKDHNSVAFLKFDIGEIEVAASRETLSYDYGTDTLGKVVAKFEQKIKELKAHDEETINAMSHPLHAMEFVENQYQMAGIMGLRMFSYKGKPLDSYYNRNIILLPTRPDVYLLGHKRSSGGLVSRKNSVYFNFNVLINHEIHAIYYEEDYKKVGIDKHSRLLLSNSGINEKVCLAFPDPLTEHKRNRINAYLGGNVIWHNLKELREEAKKTETGNTTPRQNQSVKLDDSIVRAVTYTCDLHNRHFPERNCIGRVDLNDGKEYFFATEREQHGILETSDGLRFHVDAVNRIANILSRSIEIICVNGLNAKKVRANNIRPIDAFIKEFFDDRGNNRKIAIEHLDDIFNSKGFSSEVLNTVYASDSVYFKHRFESIKRVLDIDHFNVGGKNLSTCSASRVFRSFYDTDEVDKIVSIVRDMIESIEEDLTDYYPMLELASGSYIIRTHRDKIMDYIKMVDSQNSEA